MLDLIGRFIATASIGFAVIGMVLAIVGVGVCVLGLAGVL